jgi:hypothetical protein
MDIRPRPEQVVARAVETGLLEQAAAIENLPPWHYGLRLRRKVKLDMDSY